MKLRHLAVSLAALCAAGAVPAFAADSGYFRFPALAGDQVFFTAEGDLWSAPLGGGRAARLTTHAAEETNAVVSPDGKSLAFTAGYDGPAEVYVMPVAGGPPRRVTFDGTRMVPVGWTPSGEVLYVGQSPIGPNGERVVTAVDPVSLARHTLPLADVSDAAVSPDGKTLYFTRLGLAYSGDNVRTYRGGLLGSLWRYDLAGQGEAKPLTAAASSDPASNDRRPMPWGDRIYFISDRDGHANLWSMTLDGGDRRQLTHQDGFDIRSASLDQGRIVYQLGADLHLYDIGTGQDRPLSIDLVSDFDQQRRHLVKNPLDFFDNASFAPDGTRVAVTARGRVALLGLGALRRIEVATPPAGRVRQAVLSPDGRWVYAILEGGGAAPAAEDADAPQIWRFAADGSAEAKQLTRDDAGHRVKLALSPDGKHLAHAAIDGRLFLLDLDSGDNQVIDTAPDADLDSLVWSPDSRHLAYLRSDSDLGRSQLFLYEPATKTRQCLTSDRYESHAPAFTPDGKWLYFLSDRHFDSSNAAPWGDRNMGPFFDRRTRIYALALQPGLRFPFAPRDELAPAKEADKPADKPDADKAKKPEIGPEIGWSGLADRLYEVPLAAGDYSALETDGKRLYFLEAASAGQHTGLKTLAIDDQEAKPEEFLGDVREFALSADGKKLYLRRWAEAGHAGNMLITEAGAKAPTELAKSMVRVADWAITIDPRAEWQQLFDDAWRLHRDYYYDKTMHEVDWLKVRAKFAPLVARVTDRDELNDVLAQMLAELGTMHSQIRPGDLRSAADAAKPGFLGGIFTREPGGVRIAHIYRTDRELPGERSPLARPGVEAREGDLITAVNGIPAASADDLALLLDGTAGTQTLLTLARAEPPAKDAKDPKAKPAKDRELKTIVSPVDAVENARLRYSDWEEGRREAVEQAGGGKIGYLHLRAMGKDDIAGFARDFYAQIDRDGLIIDVRHNNGGNIDSWVIEKLLRRAWAYWKPRYGQAHGTNMQQTFRGHLAVLVDETTYSDGETFAAGVKTLGLGPLIGRRTAGAGIWLSDDNGLSDRGMARAAERPQFAIGTGEWLVENKGVEPDVTVENPPNATFNGGDAQLDAAIGLLQDKLKTDPVKRL
jgi:tricorn protease